MGMDVYGNNPTVHKSKDKFPIYAKYEDMDWPEREQDPEWEKVRNKFHQEYQAYEDSNPGIYFRNNCWWWRPLWDYCKWVSDHYELDLIDKKLHESGSYNDGAGLDADGAVKLAFHLTLSIETDVCKQYAEERQQYLDSLEDDNCMRCNNNNRGEFKKRDCNSCDKTGKQPHFAKSYPFDEDNVIKFAEFLEHSGGFSIN